MSKTGTEIAVPLDVKEGDIIEVSTGELYLVTTHRSFDCVFCGNSGSYSVFCCDGTIYAISGHREPCCDPYNRLSPEEYLECNGIRHSTRPAPNKDAN